MHGIKTKTFGKSLKVIKDHAFVSSKYQKLTNPSGIQKIEIGALLESIDWDGYILREVQSMLQQMHL